MHGRLLGGRGGAVDADVVAHQVLLGVLAEPLVGVDQSAGALVADLAVVEDLRLLGVLTPLGRLQGVRLGLLLGEALVQ